MAASSETAPLLRQASISKASGETPNGHLSTIPSLGEDGILRDDSKMTWKHESILLARYSTPLVITYILQYMNSFVIVVVAGRLGTSELAAASLASMTANVTGLAVYEGLATSLDTLTSQAFGAGKKQLVGLHVQRMVVLMLLATIPIGAVWICSPWILEKLIPQRHVAHLAGDFLRFYLIGAPGYGLFEAVKRFTQAQGDFSGPLITALVCAPLNILWNWLLVFKFDLGFRGAAIAVSITYHLQPLVFLLYIRLFAPEALQCWPGMQVKRALQNWGPMIKLAFPGVITVLSEWIAFDILTFAASYLSEQHLAAQSVVMTISVLVYHIPFPAAVAASTRFGNLIGLGNTVAARTAFNTYYVIFLCIGIFDIILLTSLRHVIAEAFSDDPVVRSILVSVLPIVAAAQLFDAVCALSNALVRGLGRQKIGGWVNFGVYYAFAIPLSLFLTFGPPKMQLEGLWIGPLIGLGGVASILWLYMRCADWQKAVEDAREREE